MGLTTDRCLELADEFRALYPAAYQVGIRVANTPEDLYGKQGRDSELQNSSGGYFPASASDPSAWCDIFAANAHQEEELGRTFRHELIGHFGINTLSQRDKQALLSAIIKSQQASDLSILWGMVNKLYSGQSILVRAEEIFAAACEVINPWQLQYADLAHRAFEATCKQQLRPLSIKDLQSITLMVANNMRDRELQIQTIPVTKQDQFGRPNVVAEGTHAGVVVSTGDGWVEQKVDRQGNTVHHVDQLLSARVAVGDLVDIRYRNGLGLVRGVEKSLGLAR